MNQDDNTLFNNENLPDENFSNKNEETKPPIIDKINNPQLDIKQPLNKEETIENTNTTSLTSEKPLTKREAKPAKEPKKKDKYNNPAKKVIIGMAVTFVLFLPFVIANSLTSPNQTKKEHIIKTRDTKPKNISIALILKNLRNYETNIQGDINGELSEYSGSFSPLNPKTAYKVALILHKLIKNTDSDIDRIVKVHNWIIENTKYFDSKLLRQHSVQGVIYDKKAVCQGYALAFHAMMRGLGIEDKYVTSKIHAWNLVKVDNKFYNMDVTWDDPVQKNGKQKLVYDYFLVSDKEIVKNDKKKEHTKQGVDSNYCSDNDKDFLFREKICKTKAKIDNTKSRKPTNSISLKINPNYKKQMKCHLTQYTDGDTFYTDCFQERIRLSTVNTPESTTETQRCGVEASNYIKKIIKLNDTIYIEDDPTQGTSYSRPIKFVYLSNGESLQMKLLKTGFGIIEERYNNSKYSSKFEQAQNFAQNNKVGCLWG